jgi:hypothetical protein
MGRNVKFGSKKRHGASNNWKECNWRAGATAHKSRQEQQPAEGPGKCELEVVLHIVWYRESDNDRLRTATTLREQEARCASKLQARCRVRPGWTWVISFRLYGVGARDPGKCARQRGVSGGGRRNAECRYSDRMRSSVRLEVLQGETEHGRRSPLYIAMDTARTDSS